METSSANAHDADRLAAGRIVVVSPHLDDAVLSLGSTIARSARLGARVEVLTVFGCAPESTAAVGSWDRRSGFDTQGDAARSRRREDGEACGILGASQRVLDFGAEPYERGGTPDEVAAATLAAIGAADVVLLPGFPLVHADHAELTRLLLHSRLESRVGLYAEQPYLFYARGRRSPAMRAAAIAAELPGELVWTHLESAWSERRLKRRAIRCYRSQLWQLGLAHVGLYRMLWHERSQGGEAIAWLNPSSPRGPRAAA